MKRKLKPKIACYIGSNFVITFCQIATFHNSPLMAGMLKGCQDLCTKGFLHSIDTHKQLYDIIQGGAYGSRSVISLTNETFFRKMAAHEQNLALKATKCGKLMAGVTEILHYRHSADNRSFQCKCRRSRLMKAKNAMELRNHPLLLVKSTKN